MREDTFTNTPEDAAAYEQLRGRDEWIDNRPTRAELEAEALPATAIGDPWGDVGPIHHPTRFDLPIPAEPPF